ncbi:MAG TPA: hypothetical protein VLA69_01000, partial [Gaiellaceae bacterium]|nr:hypothetical protein [Gaiellaceae bacterium]
RSDNRAEWLTVVFSRAAEDGGAQLNVAVRVLLDAGVELRAFELEGARLSDAFLAMTEAA